MNLKLFKTKDGSHSILNEELNETYHSTHGAIQESEYVFINKGIDYYIQETGAKLARIFEVGFGTGLNALLSLRYAVENSIEIEYTSLEAFPIPLELADSLNYTQVRSLNHLKHQFIRMHECEWGVFSTIQEGFRIKKLSDKLENLSLNECFDLVYYDAFAPSKQPEMWRISCLQNVTNLLHQGGVLVTYCAKGQLKRDLKSLGMDVETLEGPPGKKEMVRATKK